MTGEYGETSDTRDETWVLYDRQLIDDELWALWAEFPARSRIFVLSDSCHSGTVTKDVPDLGPAAGRPGQVGPNDGSPAAQQRLQAVPLFAVQEEGGSGTAGRLHAGPSSSAASGGQQGRGDGRPDLRVRGQPDELGRRPQRAWPRTLRLLKVWNDGAFTGSLHDLRNEVALLMPPIQTPNYYVVGRRNYRALSKPALRI